MDRDERALLPVPEGCKTCAHVIEWRGTTGARHDCLRGYPMHAGCAWQSPRTESRCNPKEA